MLFKGFKFQSEVFFLRKIKKILIEAFKDAQDKGSKLADIVAMYGPLFSVNSDVKLDLSHTDLEAILKNETLS